jgi:probable HAF family extracellular repeat protein
LEAEFSRGFDINNAGTIVGTVRQAGGETVAFALRPQGLWTSAEPVMPNDLPVVRMSINGRGDIAGHKAVPGGIWPVAWIEGIAQELAPLAGYAFGEVFELNDAGEMVGESLNGNFVAPTAYRATRFLPDGTAEDLGTLGGTRSAAADINNQGQIVGVAENASGQFRAYLYENGVMQDIGTLGGTTANANAINNQGEIVGRSFLANGAIRAFYYRDGVMTDLGTLGGASSVAFDINDRGEIVGFSRVPNGQAHAFLYKDGVMTDLGTFGGIDSRAISINNQGEIVGHYTLADGSVHGFFYREGQMYPL